MMQQEMDENFQNTQNINTIMTMSIIYTSAITCHHLIQWGVGIEGYNVMKCDFKQTDLIMLFYVFECNIVHSAFTKENKIEFAFENQNELKNINVDYVDFFNGIIACNNGLNYSSSPPVASPTTVHHAIAFDFNQVDIELPSNNVSEMFGNNNYNTYSLHNKNKCFNKRNAQYSIFIKTRRKGCCFCAR